MSPARGSWDDKPEGDQPQGDSPDGDQPQRSPMAAASDLGAQITSYLIAGPLTFGAIGWGLDKLLHTGFLVPVGVLAGVALSMYVIWLRYGRT